MSVQLDILLMDLGSMTHVSRFQFELYAFRHQSYLIALAVRLDLDKALVFYLECIWGSSKSFTSKSLTLYCFASVELLIVKLTQFMFGMP